MRVGLKSYTAKQLLEFHRKFHGFSYKDLANQLGLTPFSVRQKFVGNVTFTDIEIQKLKNILHMNTADVVRIFYPDSILNAGEQVRINTLKDLDDYIRIRFHKEIVISSQMDLQPIKVLLHRFLIFWVRHPQQRIFEFELSYDEKNFGNKLFVIHDVLIQEKTENSIIHYRMFKRVELKSESVTLELDDNLSDH